MTSKAPKQVWKHSHPGSGRHRSSVHPKGRQINLEALEEIRSLLGELPRRRDLLIEHLHLIQDRYHCLSGAHLAALAEEMRMGLSEVYEVASFYAHFDIVKEGEVQPPKITARVCDSLTCTMMGAQNILANLPKRLGRDVRVVRAPCMGSCDRAPVVLVGHRYVEQASPDKVARTAEIGDFEPEIPATIDFDGYTSDGGYQLLRECLDGKRNVDNVVSIIEDSGLRGLGGAGFPTGRKWRIVRSYPGPRLMVVNADEGEPGTFKDRTYMESNPHRFLEGTLIAAWAVQAESVYIYLRDEYPAVREILLKEIPKVEPAGLAPKTKIFLRRGAGGYICGEESAMLESIEGKRGLPRHRPPYVAEVGLFGLPTLVQNVETLHWVTDIIRKGPGWFASHGRNGGKGLRSYSVSGRVKKPGVKLAPAGITVRELIEEYCDGMQDGNNFKGYLPGGASGGLLPASMADLPLEFGSLEKHGCFIGSHAVVIFSDQDNVKDAALNLMRFFEDESCGQCTPCRVGTEKAVKLMERSSWDEPLLQELSCAMADGSICGLGQSASNSLRCVFKHFREDLS